MKTINIKTHWDVLDYFNRGEIIDFSSLKERYVVKKTFSVAVDFKKWAVENNESFFSVKFDAFVKFCRSRPDLVELERPIAVFS